MPTIVCKILSTSLLKPEISSYIKLHVHVKLCMYMYTYMYMYIYLYAYMYMYMYVSKHTFKLTELLDIVHD